MAYEQIINGERVNTSTGFPQVYHKGLGQNCKTLVELNQVEPLWQEYIPAPPTPEEIAANKKRLIDQIASAARNYIEHQVNAALQVEIYPQYLLPNPNPMVVATVQWVKSGYMEAEVRKSQVLAGVADNEAELCDFSILGDKPYTVYQLYVAGIVRL